MTTCFDVKEVKEKLSIHDHRLCFFFFVLAGSLMLQILLWPERTKIA
jgi:hypothetical protein